MRQCVCVWRWGGTVWVCEGQFGPVPSLEHSCLFMADVLQMFCIAASCGNPLAPRLNAAQSSMLHPAERRVILHRCMHGIYYI